jgi:hypothetical protein
MNNFTILTSKKEGSKKKNQLMPQIISFHRETNSPVNAPTDIIAT